MGKNICSFEHSHILNNLLRTTVGNYFKNFLLKLISFLVKENEFYFFSTLPQSKRKTLTSMKHHVSLREKPQIITKHLIYIYKTYFKGMI